MGFYTKVIDEQGTGAKILESHLQTVETCHAGNVETKVECLLSLVLCTDSTAWM